jgi:hypothetical protein
MRRALGSLVLPSLAVVAALARWLMQGRENVYTDVATRYYVADRDVGWRVIDEGPVSLGLDAIAVLAGFAVALFVAAVIVNRWERRRGKPLPVPRPVHWAVSAIPLVVPVWAFASGAFPSGAVYEAPSGVVEAPADSITGGLAGMPAGTYRVEPHAGTAITARLKAGGEGFEARFASKIEGTWRGAPAELRQPMNAAVSVATEVVDAGIELRSKHAREDYLDGARHPRITFHLDRLLGAGPATDPGSPGAVAYRAEGTVELMGSRHPVAVTGLLVPTDEAGRRRLGFAPGDAVFRATAHFELEIRETKLAKDAGDFDGDVLPVDVSLVLRRQAERAP